MRYSHLEPCSFDDRQATQAILEEGGVMLALAESNAIEVGSAEVRADEAI
jgi:hypothetical protein